MKISRDNRSFIIRGGKQMIEKIKQNYGITLIALVVTIIVLLILAGVSISMLTGQNRNIKKSSRGKRGGRNSANR